jgi:uncharacterized protein YbjT (DUF2867 family)
VARALIVGCGCRGRGLGRDLLDAGWAVRGTTRRKGGLAAIEEAGIEAVRADPDQVWSLIEQLDGVTMVFWLLGSATGDEAGLKAIHGPRLERMLEEIVDTPVRGFVYEASGTVDAKLLERGARIVNAAAERWHIRTELVEPERQDPASWRASTLAAVVRLIGTS